MREVIFPTSLPDLNKDLKPTCREIFGSSPQQKWGKGPYKLVGDADPEPLILVPSILLQPAFAQTSLTPEMGSLYLV